jgi:hypothetical protein
MLADLKKAHTPPHSPIIKTCYNKLDNQKDSSADATLTGNASAA